MSAPFTDPEQEARRATRRMDSWILLGVAAAICVMMLFVLWINYALIGPTD